MAPALLILAAGVGSRYGGLKQMDAIGPAGETLMDYSIYDAQRAGVKRILFVIKRESEKEFNEVIIKRYKGRAEIDYVFQELSGLTDGAMVNPARVKPWGTSHAVLAGAEKIKEPFIVINADDFYGFDSFKVLTDYLAALPPDKQTEYGLVGFVLKNTLSENGAVSRGVCEVDGQQYLETITERMKIRRMDGAVVYEDNYTQVVIDGNSTVSMNMWGFTATLFPKLEEQFREFLKTYHDSTDKELLLPACIDELIKTDTARVKVLKSNAEWFGLTYKEDKASVISRVKNLIASGEYPERLFS